MKEMNNNIKVSIIIPSYKRHKDLVGRAILSLLNQTYDNIEIVLVDDNAREDLKDYRAELESLVLEISDNRICYLQNRENLGGAGARNEGIKISSGEYVTFLYDDDEYLPEKIDKQLKFMVDNELDMSFTKLNIYNEDDKLIDVREHDIKSFDSDYLRRYHLTKQITGTPTFMMKRNVLTEIGGFEVVPMGQEYYLMQKILWGDYKLGYYPECHIKAYRTSAEAISTGKNKITGENKLYKFKKQYFKILTLKERRYVRCRHYAVMAVAYKRNKKYFRAVWMLFVATICAPITAVKEAIGLRKRKKEALS